MQLLELTSADDTMANMLINPAYLVAANELWYDVDENAGTHKVGSRIILFINDGNGLCQTVDVMQTTEDIQNLLEVIDEPPMAVTRTGVFKPANLVMEPYEEEPYTGAMPEDQG